MIIGIVAIAKNFAIGKDGKLPWHHSADLKFFKETTTGNAVVMGAATWRAIGKPLPDRLNVVLTATNSVMPPAEVMRLAEKAEVTDLALYLHRDVYIIGGAKTYAAFADVIEKWLVTWVPDAAADADTFMPADFLDDFVETNNRDLGDGLVVKTLLRK
ncbi:MAG: dihydrofolate reductase [Acidobacteriota bacterium]